MTACAADEPEAPATVAPPAVAQTVEAVPEEGEYGSDPALDALYDECEAGDDQACDDLYWQAPLFSGYEEFAKTCGGRGMPDGQSRCVAGVAADPSVGTYGSDPELDALWDACEGGDNVACDELYIQSPFGSEYEAFAESCGGRGKPDGQIMCGM